MSWLARNHVEMLAVVAWDTILALGGGDREVPGWGLAYWIMRYISRRCLVFLRVTSTCMHTCVPTHIHSHAHAHTHA